MYEKGKIMIRIGVFAKMFNVSLKTLRLYEEKGLIVPHYVDIYSGYRYYNDENINDMERILLLKELGLTLNEIKHYDRKLIDEKVKEYENILSKIRKNINALKSLSQNEEVINNMKAFINDTEVVGKWELLGISKNNNDADKMKYIKDDFNIKELYFLPNGEKYWVVSWTRGIVYLKDKECPYELKDNILQLKIFDPYDVSHFKIASYRQIDNKEYNVGEIAVKDNLDIPFVEDPFLKGEWKSVDFVFNIENFDADNLNWPEDMYLNKIIVTNENEVIANLGNKVEKLEYTKGFIKNLCSNSTLSKYTYINNDYIAIEWKSGDYVYGKMKPKYYILKRIK